MKVPNTEISHEAGLDIKLPNKRITKALTVGTDVQADLHLCCWQTL